MSLVNEMIKHLLPEEEKRRVVAVYGGGFKPPTLGHFEVVKQALQENPNIDEFIILIGGKDRDGISPSESLLIWDLYKQYLSIKVNIKLSPKPPIQAIYNYAKENPEEEVLWIIGAREGNDEDFKDISSRTTSLDKYPNMDLRVIVTQGGISGTAARNASKISLEKFIPSLPKELSDEEKEQVYNWVANKIQENKPEDGKAAPYGSGYNKVKEAIVGKKIECDNCSWSWNIKDGGDDLFLCHKCYHDNTPFLNENASYSKDIDVLDKIKQLTQHMLDKGYNIEPLPKVKFVDGDSDNARDFLGKTAYYNPNNNTITLYTEGRHPKDIVRSFAHEMIHHIQNLENRLGDIGGTNTMEDDHLNDIEAEANLKGTMTFRNWTDSIDREEVSSLNENIAPIKNLKVYHSTDSKFHDFSLDYAWDGFWFTDDLDSLKNRTAGASGGKYILTRYITLKNPASWDEYDKYSIGELINMGYDGAFLPDEGRADYLVFAPKSISKEGEEVTSLNEIGADTEWIDFEGGTLTLQDVLDLTKNIPQKNYPTEKLSKIVLNWGNNPSEIERIAQVEVSKQYPILIMADEDGSILWILDGNHRAQKALRSKAKTIPAKIIKPSDLDDNARKVLGVVARGKVLNKENKIYKHTSGFNDKLGKDPFGLNQFAREIAEEVTKYQIYCDMDGVLADFERGYEELTGVDLKGEFKKGDDFWDPIKVAGVGFWAGLKWMPDGQRLWDYLKPYTPLLLSAPSRDESSRIGKHVWVKHKIPGTKLILRYAKQKQELATPDSILIDDRQVNIDQWEAAGGIGILHINTQDTIKQLQKLSL